MSGVVSIVLGVVEKAFPNSSVSLQPYLWIGVFFLFIATFLAWRDERRVVSGVQNELSNLKLDFQELKSSKCKELSVKYWDDFEEMRQTRKKAANYFIDRFGDSGDAEDLLDFFDSRVGLTFKNGRLDCELIYSDFYHWVHHYWYASQFLFRDFNEKDHTVWENFKYLFEELEKIQIQKTGEYKEPTPVELRKFLEEEADNPPTRSI